MVEIDPPKGDPTECAEDCGGKITYEVKVHNGIEYVLATCDCSEIVVKEAEPEDKEPKKD